MSALLDDLKVAVELFIHLRSGGVLRYFLYCSRSAGTPASTLGAITELARTPAAMNGSTLTLAFARVSLGEEIHQLSVEKLVLAVRLVQALVQVHGERRQVLLHFLRELLWRNRFEELFDSIHE